VSKCLVKNPELRTTAQELMEVYFTTISWQFRNVRFLTYCKKCFISVKEKCFISVKEKCDIGRIVDHHCSNFLFIINLNIPYDEMNFNG
jgi:hypothetical protein